MSAHTKAIYVSYWAARHAGLRDHVLELLEETELNALVIDIKGEDGLLYDTFTQPTVTGTAAETGLTSPEFRVDILPPPDEGALTLDLSWAETAATSAAYDQVNSLETLMAWLKERGYVTDMRAASHASQASGGATIIAVVFGVPLAYLLARSDFPGKHMVEGIIDIPIVIPHTAAGIALLVTLLKY